MSRLCRGGGGAETERTTRAEVATSGAGGGSEVKALTDVAAMPRGR